jgi:hypothetical protein
MTNKDNDTLHAGGKACCGRWLVARRMHGRGARGGCRPMRRCRDRVGALRWRVMTARCGRSCHRYIDDIGNMRLLARQCCCGSYWSHTHLRALP